jgi:hypothetical protein
MHPRAPPTWTTPTPKGISRTIVADLTGASARFEVVAVALDAGA